MFTIELSNEWNYVSYPDNYINNWIDFTDYVVKLSKIPITARTEGYSLILSSITLSLASPAPFTPVVGDRIRVKKDSGVGFYLGYVTSAAYDKVNEVYAVKVDHFLAKTKDITLYDQDFRDALEDDPYGDHFEKTLFYDGIYYDFDNYSVRGVIRAIIETACPKMFAHFDIQGVTYTDGTTESDYFVNHWFDREMLYNVGLDNYSGGVTQSTNYKYMASPLYMVLNAICIQFACNIFVDNETITFNGKVASTATIYDQAGYNDSIAFSEDPTTMTKSNLKLKDLEVKYKYSPSYGQSIVEYYLGADLEPTNQVFLPQQSEFADNGNQTWKSLAIPNHFLIFDGTYGVNTTLLDIADNARFFTPLSDLNSFVPHYLFSISSLTWIRKLYVERNTLEFFSSTMMDEKKNVLRLDVTLDKLKNNVSQVVYGE